MPSTYKTARVLCGLSQSDAAIFHKVSEATIASWSSGRVSPPLEAWVQLSERFQIIESAAVSISEELEPFLMNRQALASISETFRSSHEEQSDVASAMGLLLSLRSNRPDYSWI